MGRSYREFPPTDITEFGKQQNAAKITSKPVFVKDGNCEVRCELEMEINMYFPLGVIFAPKYTNTKYKVTGKTYKGKFIEGKWSFNRSIVRRCDDNEFVAADLRVLRKNAYIYRIGKLKLI